MRESSSTAEQAVKKWVSSVVVELGLCPFAPPALYSDSVRFTTIAATETAACLEALVRECEFLDQNPALDTAVLIAETGLSDFDHYLDVLAMSEALLSELDYDGVYQLASFHPDYQFEGSTADAVENYTNRSPFPVLQLLRENSVTCALDNFGDADLIPERNMQLMQELGLDKMLKLLDDCHHER